MDRLHMLLILHLIFPLELWPHMRDFSIAAGFALVGDVSRTCMDDDQADTTGVWSGSAPTCARK